MRLRATFLAASLAVLPLASASGQPAKPAAAAPAPGGMAPGFNSTQPIDITADSLEVFRDQRLTVFKGNVEAIQGEVRIRSPQLNLYSSERAAPAGQAGQPAGLTPGSNFGDIERMEATGPVYYITPTQQAKGDKAIYEKVPDTITMIGNVVVTQDRNVVAGDKLIIDQKTGHSTMISNTPSAPKRVRGVFYPQQQPAPGAAPAGAAPAPAAAKPAPKARAAAAKRKKS